MRNIKRGSTKEELGLSFIMYNYYKIKMTLCPERPKIIDDSIKK